MSSNQSIEHTSNARASPETTIRIDVDNCPGAPRKPKRPSQFRGDDDDGHARRALSFDD